jgi:hypothetical protein
LIRAGKSAHTVSKNCGTVHRFLAFVGNERLDRLSEDLTRAFFAGMSPDHRRKSAMAIGQFLEFATARLPVPITCKAAMTPAPRDAAEVALRRQWGIEKRAEQREAAEDLVTKLARRVIDHYLYFERRIRGEPDNLDDLRRFADDCQELIQANLPLFMGLSAEGRNIHPIIDERVKR